MAIKTRHLGFPASLSSVLALAVLFGTGVLASGQTGQTMPPQTEPPQTRPPQTAPPPNPVPRQDDDVTTRQLADMDHFLDGHPEIAEQLRKDPSLINNREFVENHPALQEYLTKHPGVRNELQENPNAFMRQENRYDRAEDRREGDRDITRRELASMDRFLDSHPEVAEQIRKDPSLVNNRQFVENHPALQEYLQNHPGVREEVKENPNAFMRQEERYDRREDDRDNRTSMVDRDNRLATGDRDRRIATGDPDDRSRTGERNVVDRDNRGELTSFGQFLGGHSNVAAQLSRDPSLATNKEYLASHPELEQYLKAHPAVTQQLTQNPQAVMNSNVVMQQSNTTGAKSSMPKTKPNPNQ
ncbi:MAG: hypothetical protein LAO30_02125 [Acidobacteriia bacterium]|nr:hypothetical protein [Terriglobia bacterium]